MAKSFSLEELRALFSYDDAAGALRWRVAASKRIKVGDIAGCRTTKRYWRIRYHGAYYFAHTLIYAHQTGAWPDGMIDHIDGDGLNNRMSNLRVVTARTNQENRRKPMRNKQKDAPLGAFWFPQTNKWKSQIRVNGRLLHLGYYSTAQEAHTAYLDAKRRMHAGNTL